MLALTMIAVVMLVLVVNIVFSGGSTVNICNHIKHHRTVLTQSEEHVRSLTLLVRPIMGTICKLSKSASASHEKLSAKVGRTSWRQVHKSAKQLRFHRK